MTKANHSNGLSRMSVQNYSVRGGRSTTSCGVEDFQKKVAEQIAELRRNELAVDGPQDFEDVDLHDHRMKEADDSQPLTVEPPLTLSKICSKLTAVEQLWVARMVKTHGKELVLARWLAYEIQINYVRYLR